VRLSGFRKVSFCQCAACLNGSTALFIPETELLAQHFQKTFREPAKPDGKEIG
jgi:hypothetical protein